jgi:glutamyl-tRNA synthetase
MSEIPKVVTRYAPSPTGFQHVGGVRTALYAYLYAKKNNGTFILRIEDTDKKREVEGSVNHIIESLHWLGIQWGEGVDIGGKHAPYKQSQRLESYKKYAQILIDKGLAYADPYTQEDIAGFKAKAESEKRAFLYRDHRPENPPVWDGTQPLRLKITTIKETTWHDVVRGDLSAGKEALDDFVLIKTDGYPTYNFAHIIDDFEMGVTHIMRADEFIASVPNYLSLYEALDITPPLLVTLPPILGEGGNKKLGKRDGAKDIFEYRDEGYLPEAMINFLAFLGWNPGGEKEIYTMDELVQAFDVNRIHKSGAMFNEEKLLFINKEHIRKQSEGEQLTYLEKYLPTYPLDLLKRLRAVMIDRISTYGELVALEKDEFRLFLEKPLLEKEKLLWKDSPQEEALQHLKALQQLLSTNEYTTADEIKTLLMPYAEAHGKGNVLWPLRVTLSGREKSIDPFTIISILGKEESCDRITTAINVLGS